VTAVGFGEDFVVTKEGGFGPVVFGLVSDENGIAFPLVFGKLG